MTADVVAPGRAETATDSELAVSVPDGDANAIAALPRWFTRILIFALVFVATAGIFGVVLLYLKWYQPSFVIVAALACAVAAMFTPLVPTPARGAVVAHIPAVAALGLVIVFGILAGAYHSEHLLTDRDPGVYLNTGRSIARSHELRPQIATGVFADRTRYTTAAPSLNESKTGQVQPGFFPMLPAVLAIGWSIGGDHLMLIVPAMLGALGLLALFALAARVLGPRWALVVLLIFMLTPLQLWFARDAYSELLVQPLVLGGLWLLLDARDGPAVRAALGGVFVAASTLARIDALMITVVAFLGAAFLAVRAPTDRARRSATTFASTLGVATFFASWMIRRLAPQYLAALHSEYDELILAATASFIVGTTAIVVARFGRVKIHWDWLRNRALFVAIAIASFGALLWALTIRVPSSPLPVPEGKPIPDALRNAVNNWHWRWSARWFVEYMGPLAVVLAIVGALYLLFVALRGNDAAAVVLCVIVPVAVFYILRPNISPDQPWAMRRYLPIVLPGIAIMVAAAFAWVWRVTHAFVLIAVTVVLALGIAIPSAVAARPFVRARMQDGALRVVHQMCHAIGRDSAVEILGGGFADLELPVTLHVFCGIPVARPVAKSNTDDLTRTAHEWQARGRRLVVVTAAPNFAATSDVPVRLLLNAAVADAHEPERVPDRRPRRVSARPLVVWVYEVVAGAAR